MVGSCRVHGELVELLGGSDLCLAKGVRGYNVGSQKLNFGSYCEVNVILCHRRNGLQLIIYVPFYSQYFTDFLASSWFRTRKAS